MATPPLLVTKRLAGRDRHGELITSLRMPAEPGDEEEGWGDDVVEVWIPDPVG